MFSEITIPAECLESYSPISMKNISYNIDYIRYFFSEGKLVKKELKYVPDQDNLESGAEVKPQIITLLWKGKNE